MARKRSLSNGDGTVEQPPLEQSPTTRPEINLSSRSKSIELAHSTPPSDTILEVPAIPVEDSTTAQSTTNLEATIAELQAALKATQHSATQREQDLLQEVATLKAEIQVQQDQNSQLQTELDKANALKTELKAQLEEARKVILQLSQVNAKPAPPIAAPKVQAAEPELETPRSAAIQPVQPAQRKPELDRKQHQVALKRILDHPTQPGRLPSMPSDSPESGSTGRGSKPEMDMGWVD